MNLGQMQEQFMEDLILLLSFIKSKGYKMRGGDLFRDPRVHGEVGEDKGYGRPNSVHKLKLAIDINLFKDGKWLSKTEDHKEIGEYWESIRPGNVWGGRWNDGNHYSVKYRGLS